MQPKLSPYAISIAQWGKRVLDCSPPTAYRVVNGEDPPPTIQINNRRLVAIGSPEYQEWLNRRMSRVER